MKSYIDLIGTEIYKVVGLSLYLDNNVIKIEKCYFCYGPKYKTILKLINHSNQRRIRKYSFQ